MLDLFLFIIIFFLSIVFSMIGIGGASIYIPLFYLFGYEIKEAIITGIILNIVNSLISINTHYKNQKCSILEYKHLLFLIIGIIIGGALGSKLFFLLGQSEIKIFFSAFLAFASYKMYKYKINEKLDKKTKIENISKIEKFLVGIIVGAIAALFGIGGGILLVPFFLNKNIQIKKASFFSHICVFFSSAYAFVLNFSYMAQIENINNLALLVIAVLIGSAIGSKVLVEKKVDDKTITKLLSLLMFIFSIKIFVDGIGLI